MTNQRRADAVPMLRFHMRNRDSVLDGSKTSTVRWHEDVAVGPVLLAFDGADPVAGEVLAVHRHRLDELTPARLRVGADETVEEYVAALRRNYYPSMPDDAQVDVIDFVVRGDTD